MTFFADALEAGLDCAIINPYSEAMMDVYYAHRVLRGLDPACADYIAYASHHPAEKKPAGQSEEGLSLEANIIRGLKDGAVAAAEALLEKEAPIDVIGGHMIPALGDVGRRFEQKQCYLPQLLMSAEAACAAFEKIREKMPRGSGNDRGSVILATVRGDIHDIGKNIVRVLLESYGFRVYDLGRDVPPDKVLEAVQETGCRLVGLSALMTTTVPAMAETIALLHEKAPSVRVVVGGAVLTADYAEKIGADHYSADAMETVRYAEQFYALVEP